MTRTASFGHSLLGEGAIIEFMKPLAAGAPGALGLDDDCAVIAPSPGHELVLKTDAIAEGVHFLERDPPIDVGWKALAVNVSDLAAKGATPLGYLLSLAFPTTPDPAWLAGFTAGLAEAQRAFVMHLLGGDTDRRPGPISITPMVLGEVPVGQMVRRATARPGDLVVVSGSLGDAALGLRLRSESGLSSRWGLAADGVASLERRYLRPEPRLALKSALRAHARAAMDVSDGLAKDLGRMCRASGVAAKIEYARLPVSPAFEVVRGSDAASAAAAVLAGDDYEVLAAIPPESERAFTTAAMATGIAVTVIGRFVEGAGVAILDREGRPLPVAGAGWDHF